jgi:hypothetical protein
MKHPNASAKYSPAVLWRQCNGSAIRRVHSVIADTIALLLTHAD